MQLHRARRSASVAVAAVALLCVLASCGTSSSESQPSPPATTAAATTSPPTTGAPTTDATAAACEDVEALKSSLEALTKVKPAEDGLSGADHRDRQRQDQPGQSGGLGLAGPPAQRGAGEDGIWRVADGSKRRDRR